SPSLSSSFRSHMPLACGYGRRCTARDSASKAGPGFAERSLCVFLLVFRRPGLLYFPYPHGWITPQGPLLRPLPERNPPDDILGVCHVWHWFRRTAGRDGDRPVPIRKPPATSSPLAGEIANGVPKSGSHPR